MKYKKNNYNRLFWFVLIVFVIFAAVVCKNQTKTEIIQTPKTGIIGCASPKLVIEKPAGWISDTDIVVKETKEPSSPRLYEPSDFQWMGVLNWNDWRWTWYSQRVLPGGGLTIPGRHVDADGYVCDENDYICIASNTLEKGTVVDTPLGKKGCVYDYCETENTLDVYVDW